MVGDLLSLNRLVAVGGELLVDVAVKSLLVLFAAALVAWGLRRRSAALQHGVWTTGFCVCLVLPLIALAAPGWNLAILPASLPTNAASSGGYSQAGRFDSQRADSQRQNDRQRDIGFAGRSPQGGMLPASGPDAEPAPSASPPSPSFSSPAFARAQTVPVSWTQLAFVCWLAGVALLAIRSGWRGWQLRSFLRKCHAVTDERLLERFAAAARRLEFGGAARLLESAGAEGPLVAGIAASKVVLPAGAAAWSDERCEMVLLHELSHAKRRDVLTQTIAGVVGTLHFFNPIAWFGLAQMRKLRELACDDMVVAAGQRPSDYAHVLLEVARVYCHRRRALAVGMARGANVERRILAILDRARNRVALSQRAIRTLLTAAVAAATLVGTVRLQSRAEETATTAAREASTKIAGAKSSAKDDAPAAAPPAADSKETPTSEAPDPEGRIMEVLITDEAGAPLPDARMVASIWELEGKRAYPTKTYVADKDGVMKVAVPQQLNILRFFPSAPGYVPAFTNFAEGTHEDGKLIPAKYHFKLQRGTKLGGQVVDVDGKPIAGVRIDVSVQDDEPNWGPNPRATTCTWLTDEDFSGGPAQTDQEGRWSINCAPAATPGDDFDFQLKFLHDDYISDENWGELQRTNGVTVAQLRDATAKVVMRRGVPVVGTITDLEGRAVTKGLVIWSDNTYFADGVNECQIGQEGQFETEPFELGKRWLTVLAPGYAPQRRQVRVRPGLPPLHFTLNPGHRVTLKVVDQHGKPIPNAYVGIGPWRGVDAIYNEKHPNVPESHIPRHADEHGLYVWDWAPEDAVTYNVSAKGYTATSATLVAKPEGAPHVVELAKQLLAAGKVTDAGTGEPIQKFSVAPVIEFQPGHLSSRLDHLKSASNGAYELPLEGGGSDSYRYRVRVEADGYRSKVSEQSYGVKDGQVSQDFALEPAPDRQGEVVDAAGKPVAGATVVEATVSIVPSIYRNKVDFGSRQIETDGEGRFQLRATSEKYLLRIFHDSLGFAEIAREPDEPIGTIALQPWANVSGQLLQAGKPVANERVLLYAIGEPPLGEPRIQGNYQALTDGDGRFEFERVAPAPSSISALLGPWRESPLASSQSEPLDLQPGERRTVALGGEGGAISGRVVATGRENDKLDKNWSLSYLISRDHGIEFPEALPRPSFDPTKPVEASWFLDPASNDWQSTRRSYFVKLTPDGAFRVNGVPPGTYDLVLRLYEQPAGCLVETIGEKVVTVEVTEADAAAGLKEIGEIEVPCRSGPRIGQSMAAFKFVDANGRELHVNDLKGRHVLMHAWASWCGPCLESMPQLKATVDRLAQQPITAVGLNLDRDPEAGKRIAEREGMSWAQNYLGDQSDLAKQLALSSVPTYYLIGPDGTLLASTTEWSAMEAELAKAFD
ncbi:M56 family metallopeptidase [Lacipirellula parvula]|uniref:Thioredoxin domain-containing protein n=1 Tax=Lacipirellula parvula TaxID=2650471 RepID=A0A5K7XFC0_9BACT|nr:M56 family metallopeptidase [Lacipirellula parvula]BBO33571.1 hypothetical protein PLANPX_3183 [Lacipirellula parvula]